MLGGLEDDETWCALGATTVGYVEEMSDWATIYVFTSNRF